MKLLLVTFCFCLLSSFTKGQNEKFDSLSIKIKEMARIWESGRGVTKSATFRAFFWGKKTVIRSRYFVNGKDYRKIRKTKYSNVGVMEKITVKNDEGLVICKVKRINGNDVFINVKNKGKDYELFVDRFIRVSAWGERDLFYEKSIN